MKPDATSLRAAVEWLRAEGLLVETDKPVSGDLELTGLQKHFDGSCPMLFNNVHDTRVRESARSAEYVALEKKFQAALDGRREAARQLAGAGSIATAHPPTAA